MIIKIISSKAAMMVAFIFLFLGDSARAQVVMGAPLWNQTSVRTSGGVSYFVQSAVMQACNYITNSPVVVNGTNFSVTVSEMQKLNCLSCPECYHNETNAVVLGKLEVGSYRLTVYGAGAFGGPASLAFTKDFTITSANDAMFFTVAEKNSFQMQVQGAPAATYTVQGSTSLTNWTPIFTNAGAPFTFATNTQSGVVQFFRVLVGPGSVR